MSTSYSVDKGWRNVKRFIILKLPDCNYVYALVSLSDSSCPPVCGTCGGLKVYISSKLIYT